MKQKPVDILFFLIFLIAVSCVAKTPPPTSTLIVETFTSSLANIETLPAITELPTFTIVPLPAMSPTPFPALNFVPEGKIIISNNGNEIVYANGVHISNLVMPLTPPPSPSSFDLTEIGASDFHWSHNGKLLAFQCVDKPFGRELKICILDTQYLKANDPKYFLDYLKIVRVSGVAKIEGFSFGPFLGSVTWSPDDKYVGVTITGAKESLCIIEAQTGNFACGISNIFQPELSAESLDVLSSLQASMLSWSPQDINKLAFLRNGTNSLSLLDLKNKSTTSIWSPPGHGEMDYNQSPIWSSDGTKITFVYTEPEDRKINGYWEEQNYVIGRVDEDGSNYVRLIDGTTVYNQIVGMIPGSYRGGNIELHISSWSPDGRFLLFEVDIQGRDVTPTPNNPNALTWGTFYLDTQTGAVIPFMVDFKNPHGRSADWGP